MKHFETIGDTDKMAKKYNRCKYELMLHGCFQRPNYRYAAVTVSDDHLCGLLLKAHVASNALAAELEAKENRRLKLRIVLSVKMEDATLANETRFYWQEQFEPAMEELLELFEGRNIHYVVGASANAPSRYNLSLIAEYERKPIRVE